MGVPDRAMQRSLGGRAAALRANVFASRAHEFDPDLPQTASMYPSCHQASASPFDYGACSDFLRTEPTLNLAAKAYGLDEQPRPTRPQRRTMVRPASAPSKRFQTVQGNAPFSTQRPAVRGAPPSDAALRTATGQYLKVCGLGQYASAFADAGLQTLPALAQLPDDEALEFLERLQPFPGHKARLLRAFEALHEAGMVGGRGQFARKWEEQLLEQICSRNEQLETENAESLEQGRVLQEENHRLAIDLDRARERETELQRVVWAQTEQLGALAAAQAAEETARNSDPSRANLQSEGCSDVHEARNQVPQEHSSAAVHSSPNGLESHESPPDSLESELLRARSHAADLEKLTASLTEQVKFLAGQLQRSMDEESGAEHAQTEVNGKEREANHSSVEGQTPKAHPNGLIDGPEKSSMSQISAIGEMTGAERSELEGQMLNHSSDALVVGTIGTLPGSLGAARFARFLAGADASVPGTAIEYASMSLAIAIEKHIVVCSAKSGKSANAECSIFRAPLQQPTNASMLEYSTFASCSIAAPGTGEELLSTCSALSGSKAEAVVTDSLFKSRLSLPNKWEISEFLLDVMTNFKMQAEVIVPTLIYMERFSESSGAAIGADSWQRISFTALMLASKIWNEESLRNAQVAELSAMYSLDEINTFECVFVQSIGHYLAISHADYRQAFGTLKMQTAAAEADSSTLLVELTQDQATMLTERSLRWQAELCKQYPRRLDPSFACTTST